MTVTAIDAARELLARRRARESLIGFTQYTNQQYISADHHRLIAASLERVLRGECKRLMICMPPRHGKSELASRRFPAYALGIDPTKQIIAASYSSELASDFGRTVRNIVADPTYKALYPQVYLAADSRAADRWHTSKGGMYVAAGVGSPITGRGADILLIDDPFKDREDADSEIRRMRVWDWYTSTAYTRLMPGGSIVVINTRWHDDDLSGKLLAEQANGGDQWEVLSLPAIDNQGRALWHEWYPIERLNEIKAVLPARDWNSLYQQNPVPDDGDYFKSDYLRNYDVLPINLSIYAASDYAVTDKGGDYTEHGIFGVDHTGNVYVIDWWSGQTTSDVWIEEQCNLIDKHKPVIWFGESGVIRKAVEPWMIKRMQDRKSYCRMEWLPSITDKPSRARSIQAVASMGKLFMPHKAPWCPRLMSQMLRFPAGKHDDAVDVFSLIGRGLPMIKNFTPKSEKKPRPPGYVGAGGWMS